MFFFLSNNLNRIPVKPKNNHVHQITLISTLLLIGISLFNKLLIPIFSVYTFNVSYFHLKVLNFEPIFAKKVNGWTDNIVILEYFMSEFNSNFKTKKEAKLNRT